MLTVIERDDLAVHEAVIEKGLNTFVDVGLALLAIRDGRLYRSDYATFEDYCRDRWGMERRQAYRLMDASEVVKNVSHGTQFTPSTERQARPLTALEPGDQRIVWQRAVETAPNGHVTGAHVQRAVEAYKSGDRPHVANNSGNNEWYTPPDIIAAAHRVLREIDLDPASSPKANETVGAKHYFTAEDDGLKQPWYGRVWMNPPYSQPLVSEFAEKWVQEVESGHIANGLVLVNNATETRWFQNLLSVCDAVCFLSGRVRYLDETGEARLAPLQGQAVLYFGADRYGFAGVFDGFGKVLHAE